MIFCCVSKALKQHAFKSVLMIARRQKACASKTFRSAVFQFHPTIQSLIFRFLSMMLTVYTQTRECIWCDSPYIQKGTSYVYIRKNMRNKSFILSCGVGPNSSPTASQRLARSESKWISKCINLWYICRCRDRSFSKYCASMRLERGGPNKLVWYLFKLERELSARRYTAAAVVVTLFPRKCCVSCLRQQHVRGGTHLAPYTLRHGH